MSKRVLIGKKTDFPQGKLKTVKVEGQSVVVANVGGTVCAVKNQCSHLPLPINGGSLDGDVITCPWHNSQFNICTGENVEWVRGALGVKLPGIARKALELGQKEKPLTTYTVVEEEDSVYVEL